MRQPCEGRWPLRCLRQFADSAPASQERVVDKGKDKARCLRRFAPLPCSELGASLLSRGGRRDG